MNFDGRRRVLELVAEVFRLHPLDFAVALDDNGQVVLLVMKHCAAEIRRIFTNEELRTYFAMTTRVGAVAHVSTEEQYQTMRDAGALDEDAITGATDAILFERARALLLGGAASDDLL